MPRKFASVPNNPKRLYQRYPGSDTWYYKKKEGD